MTMLRFSAPTILVRWCKPAVLILLALAAFAAPSRPTKARPAAKKTAVRPAPRDLAGLVRAYREAPAPSHRAAITAYAAAHPKEAALAKLALGVAEFEHANYAAAIAALQPSRVPQLADYAAYYLSFARAESKDFAPVPKDLARVHTVSPASPFRARAWILEARALAQTRPAEALRLLNDQAADLPQPAGDLAFGEVYQAAGNLARAAVCYQRVYYQYPVGEAGEKAAAALLAVRDAMGAAYPAPTPELMLRRGDRLVELRDYDRARAEFQTLAAQLAGVDRDRARVRAVAIDIWRGEPKIALASLRGLGLDASDADAERLYYIAEASRRLKEDDGMLAAVEELGQRYPESSSRLRALSAAAGRMWLTNRPERYVPLFRTVAEHFPSAPTAPHSSWRTAFAAHMSRDRDADNLIREHVRRYPSHSSAATALYFLGRRAETAGDPAAARAYYTRVPALFPNHFYSVLARERLAATGIATAVASDAVEKWLAAIPLPERVAPAFERTAAVKARVERVRLLRSAGLNDLADAELRFGAKTDGQAWMLAAETAAGATPPHRGLQLMKTVVTNYLTVPFEEVPRKLWEPLFPMPWRTDLVQQAEGRGLDPYVLAGLIRQESEFNPGAVSRARAYGLTQVRPVTGREFARRAGVGRVTTATLVQPVPNLKLGATILRSLLDRYDGRWELALAGYNAGPSRVAEWLRWNTYQDQAEFIESIPFTETREYVQAVLRNADIYRKLYGTRDRSLTVAAR